MLSSPWAYRLRSMRVVTTVFRNFCEMKTPQHCFNVVHERTWCLRLIMIWLAFCVVFKFILEYYCLLCMKILSIRIWAQTQPVTSHVIYFYYRKKYVLKLNIISVLFYKYVIIRYRSLKEYDILSSYFKIFLN